MLARLDHEVLDLKNRRNALEMSRLQLESDTVLQQTRLNELEAEKSHFQDLLHQQEQDLADVNRQTAHLQENLRDHERDVLELKERFAAKQREIQDAKQTEASWFARVEDAKRDQLLNESQLQALEKEISSLQLRLKAAEDRKSQQQGIVSQRQRKQDELKASRKDVLLQIEEATNEYELLKAEAQKIRNENQVVNLVFYLLNIFLFLFCNFPQMWNTTTWIHTFSASFFIRFLIW